MHDVPFAATPSLAASTFHLGLPRSLTSMRELVSRDSERDLPSSKTKKSIPFTSAIILRWKPALHHRIGQSCGEEPSTHQLTRNPEPREVAN